MVDIKPGLCSRHHTPINSVVKERVGLGEDFIEAGKVCVLKGD